MDRPTTHITEVLCSLKFDPSLNEWDSTYFGKYHDKLIPLGYTDKQEKKEIKLQLNFKGGSNVSQVKEGVSNFIFRNQEKKTAVMIGPHFVSFHKLAPYTNWDDLMNNVLEPCFKQYKEMGLGKGLMEVQCTYVNNMEIREGEHVYDKIKIFVPPTDSQEKSIQFQGVYELGNSINATIKLNWNKSGNPMNPGQKGIFFECSTFVKANHSEDYKGLAKAVHDAANKIYDQVKKQ